MSEIKIKRKVEFDRRPSNGRHRKSIRAKKPVERKVKSGRTPRISKLMALAIRFEQLINDGHVRDQAELAELGRVTRARVTQIMNLLNLAPEIQEALLFLPPVEEGRDSITERMLRPIVAEVDWGKQRAYSRGFTANLVEAG